MTHTHNTRFADAMIFPALGMLIVIFVFPVGFFIFESLEGQSFGQITSTAYDVLLAPAVVNSIVTTNVIAAEVTLGTLLVGYPIAFYLTRTAGWRFYLIMFGIVAPTLTSTVVRTFALMVLGGRAGIVNSFLLGIGILESPAQLLYNRAAVVVAMVYVLLPYMVLTLYASMRAIDVNLMKASRGLGASEFYAFSRVFFPLTLNGVIAGSIMVYIFSMGYYLTPALVGGRDDVMIAQLIQYSIDKTLDWGSAAFMSLVLTGMTLVLFVIYCRFADIRNLMGRRT